MPRDLRCQHFEIAAGGQRHDGKAAFERFDDGQSLAADRTSRTENGDWFQIAHLRGKTKLRRS
jgi:hypothetical protein